MTDTCHLHDGLTLSYAHYRPRHDLLEHSTVERNGRSLTINGRSLTITVALEGQSSTVGMDGQCFNFVAGHSTLAAFSSARAERRFPRTNRSDSCA